MSIAQAKEQLTVPAWFSAFITIASIIGTGGVAWGLSQSKNAEQDRRLDNLETAYTRINDIRESMGRIEGRLGIPKP